MGNIITKVAINLYELDRDRYLVENRTAGILENIGQNMAYSH